MVFGKTDYIFSHTKGLMKAQLISVRGNSPRFGSGCRLAPGVIVAGDVECGNNVSIWFHAVLRGDVCKIRIGNDVNIQDQVMIHGTFEKTDVKLGDRVSVGHGAKIHGCEIHDDVLVGMGAIVMDGVVAEQGVIIAAGAVVLENTRLEAGYLYAGVPAQKIKPVSSEMQRDLMQRISKNYRTYAGWYGDVFVDPSTLSK